MWTYYHHHFILQINQEEPKWFVQGHSGDQSLSLTQMSAFSFIFGNNIFIVYLSTWVPRIKAVFPQTPYSLMTIWPNSDQWHTSRMLHTTSSVIKKRGLPCPLLPPFRYQGCCGDSHSSIFNSRDEATLQMVKKYGRRMLAKGLCMAGPSSKPWAAYLQASFMWK